MDAAGAGIPDQSSRSQGQFRTTRGRYTSQACLECQRRKRKCTGDEVCTGCRLAGVECKYTTSRGSQHRRVAARAASRSAIARPNVVARSSPSPSRPQQRPEGDTKTHECPSKDFSAKMQTLEQRCETLEREVASLKTRVASHRITRTATPIVPTAPTAPTIFSLDAPTSIASSSDSTNVFEHNKIFVSEISLPGQIDRLDRSVTHSLAPAIFADDSVHEEQENVGGEVQTCQEDTDLAAITRLVQQARLDDPERTLHYLDFYFQAINPHYPCINEVHLRSQLAAFLSGDSAPMSQDTAVQFALLLSFLVATARILSDSCKAGDPPAGFTEFRRGESLLKVYPWLEKPTLTTIQILIVRATYCQYASRINAAYDTIGIAVRLCFRLGLHNGSLEAAGDRFYDNAYRQRIFWSTYCLNNSLAQNAGVPELIRELDFNVSYPQCVDDKMLLPNCPRLPEVVKRSPIPYLIEVIKHAKLCSQIWDAMFGAKGQRPNRREFIAGIERQIQRFSEDIPEFLRWPSGSEVVPSIQESLPLFVRQQSLMLYLRLRAIRLLLRAEDMMALSCEDDVLKECIRIAAEMVGAVEKTHYTESLGPYTRQAQVVHLTGPMVHMICVILNQKSDADSVQTAVGLLDRASKVMEALAEGFAIARRTLQKLRRPLRAARFIIQSRWPEFTFDRSAAVLRTSISPMQNSIMGLNDAFWEPMVFDDTLAVGPEGNFADSSMWQHISLWSSV